MCFTVPTPQDSEEGPDNGARTNEASANLNDVEDWWIIEHARQVLFHNGSGIPSRHEAVTFHVIISHKFTVAVMRRNAYYICIYYII